MHYRRRSQTHSQPFRVVAVGLSLAAVWLVAGCERERAKTAAQRPDLLLSSPPPDALSITTASEQLSEPADVTLVGRIDAGEVEPFEQGRAVFMLSELPDEAHAGGDPNHADNCPFCKRRLANAPKAVVEIQDQNGQVISVDARDLLGIQAQDIVTVVGRGRFEPELDTVLVTAQAVHVAPSAR